MHNMHNFRNYSYFIENMNPPFFGVSEKYVIVTLLFLSRYHVNLTLVIFLSSISMGLWISNWIRALVWGERVRLMEWTRTASSPSVMWRENRENRRMIVLFYLQRKCCCKQSKQRGKKDIKHSDIPATLLDSWSCDSADNLIQSLSSKTGSNLNMNFHRIGPFIPLVAFSMWLSSNWPPKR